MLVFHQCEFITSVGLSPASESPCRFCEDRDRVVFLQARDPRGVKQGATELDKNYEKILKQAEAEVVPSSSSSSVKFKFLKFS